MNRGKLGGLAVAWGGLVVVACGGAMPPASSPPPSETKASSEAPAGVRPRADMAGASEEAPAAAPPGAPEADVAASAPGSNRAAARAELQRAQAALEASAGDCAGACRALASMERATSHLCELSGEDDDRRRCDDAKKRLGDARDRVRRQCGACSP
jgi:hypothetical protein